MNVSQWLAMEWARQTGPVLSSMTGEALEAAVPPGDAGAPAEGDLRIARRLREIPEAEIRLAVEGPAWQGLGAAILAAAGIGDATQDEIRSAFLEAVDQSLGQLASELGRVLGKEVSWEPVPEQQGPEPAFSAWAPVEFRGASAAFGRAWIAASAGFPLAGHAAPTEPGQAKALQPAGEARSPMLDLLMEVDLPVGVTFGRTQLRLKDAIKLTSGSIVELNRSIIEPVEVIVNNCVIARGEVVVIEGNYGVRIQEIVSREERLRTLF